MPFTNNVTHPNFLSETEAFLEGYKPAILLNRYAPSSLREGETPKEPRNYQKISKYNYPSFYNEATNKIIFFQNKELLEEFILSLRTLWTMNLAEENNITIPKTFWNDAELGAALGYPPSAIASYLELVRYQEELAEVDEERAYREPFGGAPYIQVNAWGNHFVVTKERLTEAINEYADIMKSYLPDDLNYYDGVYIQDSTYMNYILYKETLSR